MCVVGDGGLFTRHLPVDSKIMPFNERWGFHPSWEIDNYDVSNFHENILPVVFHSIYLFKLFKICID